MRTSTLGAPIGAARERRASTSTGRQSVDIVFNLQATRTKPTDGRAGTVQFRTPTARPSGNRHHGAAAKPTKQIDRRVQRTRQALRNAITELLLVRGWDRISVQHLCARANIGRSTFYMHFADKEALLRGTFDDLGKALRAQLAIAARGDTGCHGFARFMIEHVHDNRRLFGAIVGRRSGIAVQTHFRRILLELFKEELTGLAHLQPRLDATTHYVAGAFFELLVWWHEARDPVSPSALVELFDRLTNAVLAVR